MYALAFRLGALRESGQTPDAPTAREFIWAGMGFGAMAFAVGGRRREIADRTVTVLAVVARAALLISGLWVGFCALA